MYAQELYADGSKYEGFILNGQRHLLGTCSYKELFSLSLSLFQYLYFFNKFLNFLFNFFWPIVEFYKDYGSLFFTINFLTA
jgi:hypothetical protein